MLRRSYRKRGKTQVVYGVLTDASGCPLAVSVYPGNTSDPATLDHQVARLKGRFGLERVVLVGDRGMLTEARIESLRRHPGLGWISALRASATRWRRPSRAPQPSARRPDARPTTACPCTASRP